MDNMNEKGLLEKDTRGKVFIWVKWQQIFSFHFKTYCTHMHSTAWLLERTATKVFLDIFLYVYLETLTGLIFHSFLHI
jgi:hypothetical protein